MVGCNGNNVCYADAAEHEFTVSTLNMLNPYAVALGVLGSLAVTGISMMKPIVFWMKSDRAYGYVDHYLAPHYVLPIIPNHLHHHRRRGELDNLACYYHA